MQINLFTSSADRVTVEEYHRMDESGLFGDEHKLELLEGYLSNKKAISPLLAVITELTGDTLRPSLPQKWRIRSRLPVTTELSEPEPDLAVVSGSARSRLTQHPQPGQIAMVMEVAETSLERDREKRRIYARAEIPVYWIINLVDFHVEVYTDPNISHTPPGYTTHRNYSREEQIPLVIDGDEVTLIDVADLLLEVKK